MSQYGALPLAESLPADVPPLTLSPWLVEIFANITPPRLLLEMSEMAGTVPLNTVYAYNLHYELHGMGCITAAVPTRRGSYRFCRRLDWLVGFNPVFRSVPLAGTVAGTRVRYTPGFVGALSGYTQEWGVAMNMSPRSFAGIELAGTPMAWILRRALARSKEYADTKRWLLRQVPIRPSFVILVAARKACWLQVGGDQTGVMKEVNYPTPLVVGNSMTETSLFLPEWQGVREEPFQSTNGFVLDRYTHAL